jgi:hypothetical protein
MELDVARPLEIISAWVPAQPQSRATAAGSSAGPGARLGLLAHVSLDGLNLQSPRRELPATKAGRSWRRDDERIARRQKTGEAVIGQETQVIAAWRNRPWHRERARP